eukprot:m.168482 g.168482  ORF g.168482 m.168482 type:complete len:88 (-) comp24115_c0_seq4:66-329(-)
MPANTRALAAACSAMLSSPDIQRNDSRLLVFLQDVAVVVEYIRREIHALDSVSTKDLFEDGKISFGPPPVRSSSPPEGWTEKVSEAK